MTTSAVTPTSRQPHIQGLRAVAVLVVVLFHAGLPVRGGFVGVDVFFVISGYVITAMLQRELEARGRIDFRRFYLRRFKRLTPALALTVSVTVAVSALVLSPLGMQQRAASTAMGAMALGANVVIAFTTGGCFDAPGATNPLLNMWSLSVEEQFYLAFPVLMLVMWAWAARRGTAAHVRLGVGVVGAASFALAWSGSQDASAGHFLTGFYSPFTRAWEFAAGALLALTPAVRWTREGATLASVAGAGLLGLSLTEITSSTPFPGTWTLVPVSSALLLISAGTRSVGSRATKGSLRTNMIGALLSSAVMVRIGDWSYSLYLWHWPCIVFASMVWPSSTAVPVIAAALSVIPALLSYRFVEAPIRARDYSARGLIALVILTFGAPLLLAFGLQSVADHVWKPRVATALGDARAQHAGYSEGCHYEPGDGARDPRPCTWNAEQSGQPVYLLGDSNAAQFEEALIDATRTQHRPFTASTTSGCPMLDVVLQGPDFPGYGESCRARNARLLQWMQTVTPGTVFIAASDDYWFNPGWSLTAPDGVTTSESTAMIAQMQASLQRVVTELQRYGHRVVLVQTIPHWMGAHAWDPASCTLAETLAGCRQEMPLSFALQRSGPAQRAIAAVAKSTGSAVLDVTHDVCPRGRCVTSNDSIPVYRDATHITVAMSHALAQSFEAALHD